MIEPLPEAVRTKLRQNTHPGLMLDKFARSWDPDARDDARGGGLSERIQKPALEDVVRLSNASPPGLVFSDLLARRQRVLGTAQAATFSCRTAGPLTLHLARASALENAGICLHPVYGFTYLPASGLKAMTRPATGRTRCRCIFWPSRRTRRLSSRWRNAARMCPILCWATPESGCSERSVTWAREPRPTRGMGPSNPFKTRPRRSRPPAIVCWRTT